jgi:hypothetical protein
MLGSRKIGQYPEELEEIFTQRDSAYRAVAQLKAQH